MELEATRVSVEPPSQLVLPPSRRPYGPGDVIDGKYELESLLGKGGMGEVWTARNATLDVRRAVKLILADTGSAESTDRLLHEAQAAARLSEPSIVRVFDFGKTAWGDPYIVMEMLEGEDLMSIIRRRERLSPTKAVRVLLPVIRALVAAHAHGIVHRDLKPENIFLAKLPDGRVQPKLLDFGIAKLKNAAALRLTTDGAVMGSPLYMAPEQARGEDVDERADLWAICVVLYEAITGNPPFVGESRTEVIRAASDATPLRLSQHGVEDDSLWPIISRGLEKERDARWSSMEELGKALARWLLDSGCQDDITGASLQATWFRSSRQSLFASSSPPRRISLELVPAPKVGAARFDAARLRALLATARRWLVSLRHDAQARRRGAVLAAALGALVVLVGLVVSAGDEGLAADPTPAAPPAPTWAPVTTRAAPVEAATLTPAVQPFAPDSRSGEASAASGVPAEPEAHDLPEAVGGRRGKSEPARARRKPSETSPGSAREKSKEHRRSKLIDPYR
jgi:serine/threonine-protein kinase